MTNVQHPSEWIFGGYNEIQSPRRKCVIIAYEKLSKLVGANSYDSFQFKHRELVNEALLKNSNCYDDRWTRSIAVGEEQFVKHIKEMLGGTAVGRQTRAGVDCHEFREHSMEYNAHFNNQKGKIGPENTYVWNEYSFLSNG